MKKQQNRIKVLVCFVAFMAFHDNQGLNGEFVYDDSGTITKNRAVVVGGGEYFWDDLELIWKVDFWGEVMGSEKSHKSFRPITTLSFRLNFLASGLKSTFWFHMVNVVVHALNTLLATELIDKTVGTDVAITSGLLFATHPIHSEAVCNITGRADLLMSFFFLGGLLGCSTFVFETDRRYLLSGRRTFAATLFSLVMTFLSMLSKEQGVTLAASCLLLDFLYGTKFSFRECTRLLSISRQRREDDTRIKARLAELKHFVLRSIFLASGMFLMSLWRLRLNGNSRPNFIPDQNPAAFAKDPFTRIMSMNYVYIHYIDTIVFRPWHLCCDWSGKSIALVETVMDWRTLPILLLWVGFIGLVLSSLFRMHYSQTFRGVLFSSFGLTFLPFLLSSNLLITTGTMKAERIAYLPSLGICVLMGMLLEQLRKKRPRIAEALFMATLISYTSILRRRSHAWSNGLDLWESAFEVNPQSSHTRYNFGLELTKAGRNQEADKLLEELVRDVPDDIAARYVFGINLRQLNRCEEANLVADQGLKILERKKQSISQKDLRLDIVNDESFMLTLKSYCADNVGDMSIFAEQAIRKSPSNSQAQGRVAELIELAKKLDLA